MDFVFNTIFQEIISLPIVLCLLMHNIGSKQERESLRSLRSYFEFYLKICFTDYSSYIKR